MQQQQQNDDHDKTNSPKSKPQNPNSKTLTPSSPPSTPPLTVDETAMEPPCDDVDVDVSGKTMELCLFDGEVSEKNDVDGLYVYKNVFNVFPKSMGNLGTRLKTLKFFANEINLFPDEFRDCFELECLQVKVASIGFSGLPLTKLKSLKELELSKAPPRPSGFPILAEIAALQSLTKLSVCHFSIRYLPPEISCLSNLEYLDLSFNKMRSLPQEICSLSALISLKVANNKLVKLPGALSSLQRLENLDLSRNRLTSLGSLDLNLMQNLQKLNLKCNKLLNFQIPSWVCCNLEGNVIDTCGDDLISSAVEMDVLEATTDVIEATIDDDGVISYDVSSSSSPYHLPGSSLSDRCSMKRRLGKRWKRRQYLQQRTRVNHSKKWKFENHCDILTIKPSGKCGTCKKAFCASDTPSGCASNCVEDQSKQSILENNDAKRCLEVAEDDGVKSKKRPELENCNCADHGETVGSHRECSDQIVSHRECSDQIGSHHESSDGSSTDDSPSCKPTLADRSRKRSSSQVLKSYLKCKRQSDRIIDNPKPRKSRKSTEGQPDVSRKYNHKSFCGVEDRLPDGFYDAGRDRPFMSLADYEQNLEIHSREVILLDREMDEELDAVSLSAQVMVSRLMKLTSSRLRRDVAPHDNLLVATWLALFVSDRFGGSDKSLFLESVRKDVSGSNYRKPFVCTCATGNSLHKMEAYRSLQTMDDTDMRNLCETSIQTIKARQNSVVVPIGTLQLGVCRHRAVLMKYLCDRMEPPVPCELIRGYVDFSPHAWNAILVRKGGSWVRMIVDACRPHDIREEMDPEYFCRYIPLSRITSPLLAPIDTTTSSCFPTISECDEVEKVGSSSLIVCNIGSVEAAAKVRSLEVSASSLDAIRKFELTCVGEVRMLGALRNHSCIVEIYGHKISSEWIAASNEKPEKRILRCTILMEYIRGGTLKGYIEKLLKAGEKHVPVDQALYIARDVACALKELHSKHIIHRDIKSENVLIDLEQKKADGSPIVKLCDFDIAIPLRSPLHTCCISHLGIPSPDLCVGTPRWMAPEVLLAINDPKPYGMEIDIWSYGCMLFELLTLQVPYMGLSDSSIHGLIQSGKRPPLTVELEQLSPSDEASRIKSSEKFQGAECEVEGLRFLVDLFKRCTNSTPADRPRAEDVYDMLLTKTSAYESVQ
ncbi:uncharacterized protein LOC141619128 [Silene latifolia]|uniref:uncharacterized protein LOC141619128 n=1 Tax=Silene latifolia TaxID=37657 RepID=UPI003D78745E